MIDIDADARSVFGPEVLVERIQYVCQLGRLTGSACLVDYPDITTTSALRRGRWRRQGQGD